MPQLTEAKARPGLGSEGRAQGADCGDNGHSHYSKTVKEACLLWPKRGRLCNIGKLVLARPLGEFVLAYVYRNRQEVGTVSIPPAVLAYARREAASWWVIRQDTRGLCWGLPLDKVEASAWYSTSQGAPELFVPLSRFQALPWQEWGYIAETVVLGQEEPEPVERQLPLFGVAGGAP